MGDSVPYQDELKTELSKLNSTDYANASRLLAEGNFSRVFPCKFAKSSDIHVEMPKNLEQFHTVSPKVHMLKLSLISS